MRHLLLAALLALLPATALAQQAVGNGPLITIPLYYASTNSGSNTSGTGGTYGNYSCQTGSFNCSSGTLSFTVGNQSNGINNEWLVTVWMFGTTAELTSQIASLCVASASTYTVAAASWNQTGAICQSALTNRFAGSASFADNNLTDPGLQAIVFAQLTIANGATFSMTCGSTVASGSAATIFGFCSATAVPY